MVVGTPVATLSFDPANPDNFADPANLANPTILANPANPANVANPANPTSLNVQMEYIWNNNQPSFT